MASSDQKRRLPEPTPSVPSRPLKKRFTSTNVASTAAPVPTSLSAAAPAPPTTASQAAPVADWQSILVKPLSKGAWLKKMKQAKALCEELMAKGANAETQSAELDAACTMMQIQWNLIERDLVLLTKSKLLVATPSLDDSPINISAAEHAQIEKALVNAKELQNLILDQIRTWSHHVSDTISKDTDASTLATLLKKEMDDLRASFERGSALSKELKRRPVDLVQQSKYLLAQISAKETGLQQSHEMLDDCTTTLKNIEKRHDRTRSKVVAVIADGGVDDVTEDDLDVIYTGPAVDEKSPSPAGQLRPDQQQQQQQADGDQGGDQGHADVVEEHQWLVEERNREIATMRLESQNLIAHIDRLQDQLASLPESRVVANEYYKNLQSSFDFCRHRAHHLDAMRTVLNDTLNDLSRQRDRWSTDIRAAQTTETAAVDTETRRLENDVARIRQQHDDLQSKHNDIQARNAKIKDEHMQIIQTAEKKKDYIASLQNRLKELNIKPLSVGGPLESEWKSLQPLLESIAQYQTIMQRVKELEENWDAPSAREHIAQMTADTSRLEKALDGWPINDHPSYKVMTDLPDAATEKGKLELQLEAYTKTEDQFVEQLDRVGAILGRLAEQGSRPVFNKHTKDDIKNKLKVEISKFAQTFPSIRKERDERRKQVDGLKQTSESQKKIVDQLYERERDLAAKLADKEFEALRMNLALEEDKNAIEMLTQKVDEAKLTVDQLLAQKSQVKRACFL
ncbi:hypothetical protein BC940DRAFT_49947 [Gongronella butleri]|nr:hypothetical protein BC940DRAFT_49947 [Gongronella butleri]